MRFFAIMAMTNVLSRRVLLSTAAAASAGPSSCSCRFRTAAAFICRASSPFCLRSLRSTTTAAVGTRLDDDRTGDEGKEKFSKEGVVVPTSTATTPSPSAARSPLPPSKLRWRCDPSQFDILFETTADLDGLEKGTLLGSRARASSAIELGVSMKQKGYNLYVLGPYGAGKRTLVRNYLERRSLSEPPASDWAYAHNFDEPGHPRALRLPAGLGVPLRDDLVQLVEDIQIAVPAAFESEKHRNDLREAKEKVFMVQSKALEELGEEAREHDIAIQMTSGGFVMRGPISKLSSDGEGNDKELPPEKQEQLAAAIEMLRPKLDKILNSFPQLKREADKQAKELKRAQAKSAVEFLFTPLKARYADLPAVVEHLEAVEEDVIERAEDIQGKDEEEKETFMSFITKPKNHPVQFQNYKINLLVDNNETTATGAPVVYEENPMYYNLIGKTEHVGQFGAFLTDFSLIKAGALHRANGGYLVLDARDVLMQPYSWEALKRCLRSGTIKIESMGAELGLISTVSLQPEPIDLDVKVVLLGDRLLYYLLCQLDPEFNDLFKVAADFDDEMDRSPEACRLFAQMLATLVKEKDLKPMDREAVAATIEQAARQVGDQEKLSTHMRSCVDLLCESDYFAKVDNSTVISKEHVTKAIEQQVYRADRIRQLIYEQIRRGTLLVDVDGSRVGQVNGLSVMSLGSFMFGRPSRITATARLGRGKVLDIEREVELGGPLHSKGVMILSSFLSSRYALDCPLCMAANLVFEQSYGLIEGDSASMAELCALLSALSNVPINQGLAITGSVNQFGEAQPIGGATEKIEGFYDVCKATGLTGKQGVLIPESNLQHLMLRPDVLDAVDEGKFAVYTYSNVNEAMELLTSVEAGDRGVDGSYPAGTMNARVDQRLHEFAEMLRKFSDGDDSSEESSKKE